jgi:hypothetical protein
LRFGTPIDINRPDRTSAHTWIFTIKDRVQTKLETTLAELLRIRDADSYRELNPTAWHSAVTPPGS